MAKVIDITEKLGFTEKPVLKIKTCELEVNDDAETVLKVLGCFNADGGITPARIVDICNLIFTDESKKRIQELKLNFRDFQTAITIAANLIMGYDEEEEEGNTRTQGMTS